MTEFKKGQAVWIIANWNHEGTFTYRRAIVHSCGAKQMVLHSPEGEFIGRNFRPASAQWNFDLVIPRGSEQTESAAWQRAKLQSEAYVARETETFNQQIARRPDDASYFQGKLAALKAGAQDYVVALAECHARIAARLYDPDVQFD